MARALAAFVLLAGAAGENTSCIGPNCWSCPEPFEATECVKSSWIDWKNERSKFQAVCKGRLVRWGDDSGVQDCGIPCFACSYIRACCDKSSGEHNETVVV
eukprot:TRINITY_DN78293_c0_g1_i1.p1 TRINITY_DN78293_c0_g1~~TRINITY_DN78293_c0_g1_i1.p1  ORF type:complete len:101 (-),score=18.02 TRINITY_DN78293_c0_g1_i1:217-519(-)